MAYAKVSSALSVHQVGDEVIAQFKTILGEAFVIVDEASKNDYAHDKTEDYFFLPEVVIKPRTPEEISQILQLCNAHHIPVTPRGAGTGLAGGALPIKRGVILSME